jgi:hypothetical protein
MAERCKFLKVDVFFDVFGDLMLVILQQIRRDSTRTTSCCCRYMPHQALMGVSISTWIPN